MRRTMAIGAIVIAMLAGVGIAGATLVQNGNSHLNAWIVTQDLPAGATVSAAAAQRVSIPSGADAFTVMTSSPSGKQLAHAMKSGDVLRPDDFVTSTMVEVPVSFKVAPGLSANDSVDIYAAGTGANTAVNALDGTELIARNVNVVSVGSPTVISVPASQEPLWVALSSSAVTLIAARSGGVGVPTTNHNYTPDQALTVLSQLASGGS